MQEIIFFIFLIARMLGYFFISRRFIILLFITISLYFILRPFNIQHTAYLSCDRSTKKCEITRIRVISKESFKFSPKELLGAELRSGSRYKSISIGLRKSKTKGTYIDLKTTRGYIYLGDLSNYYHKTSKDKLLIDQINHFVNNPEQINLYIEVKKL